MTQLLHHRKSIYNHPQLLPSYYYFYDDGLDYLSLCDDRYPSEQTQYGSRNMAALQIIITHSCMICMNQSYSVAG